MLRNLRHETPSLYTRALTLALAAGGSVLNRLGPRPYAAVGKIVGAASGRGRLCSGEIAPGTWFTFDLGDFYWNRLAYSGFEYEPELRKMLEIFSKIPYTFIDCGANYGYWSVLVASPLFGRHRVIAVEASPKTLVGLRRNVAPFSDLVAVFGNAIAESSGQELTLFERGSHAGASLKNQWLGNDRPISGTFAVKTICIDDLIGQASPPVTTPLLIKLDVEGVEIPALRGAERCLAQDSLVIFEEYGEDTSCEVAEFVLSLAGIEVFFIDDDGRLETITSVEQVRAIKKHPRRGYNFLATRGGTSFHRALTTALPTSQTRF